MTDNNFSLGERQFKLSKINAMKQFHIVRRIAPILGDLLPAMKGMSQVQKADDMSASEQFDKMAELAAPIMTGLSKLSDKDADMVLMGLLAAVEMKQETGNWARLSNGDQLMFQDLDLPVLLQAAGKAFAFNLSGFFAVLPQVS